MLTVFLAAGCVGGGSEGSAPGGSKAPNSVDQKQGTSTIEGRVTDPELSPLDGAAVRIIDRGNISDQGLVLATNATGGFAARGLQASNYIVYVSLKGYHDASPKTVAVGEGATERVVFILDPIFNATSYHASRNYQVKFTEQICAIHPAKPTVASPWCVTGYQTSNITVTYDHDPLKQGELHTFFVEMRWTPTVGQCAGGMRSDIYSPEQSPAPAPGYVDTPAKNDSNPYHWDNVPESAKSPTRVMIPRDGTELRAMHSPQRTALNDGVPIKIEGKWTSTFYAYPIGAMNTPVDYSCAVDQTVAVWLTQFYEAPAPEGWSVFAGA